ncbi:Uncharacterized protein C15orf57, partial [Buceros rhinoceros silvestris]
FTMRMIESVDSVVTRSSEDLWAEICACLPHPEQKDAGDAFTDSFVDSCADGASRCSGSDGSSQTNLKPWAPLNDSEVYLASLERRLLRLKGLSQEVTSKDMLRTLAQAKKESWDRFLQEKFDTLEHLKRWLHPDKVAISTEEVQYLIPPESQPEKQESEEDPPAAEQ